MARVPTFRTAFRFLLGSAAAALLLAQPVAAAVNDGDCVPSTIDEAWLIEQETAGGHTLDRHVNRNGEELNARLQREPNIPAASSFQSRAIATGALTLLLSPEETDLDSWADRANPGERAVLKMGFKDPVGITVVRGNASPIPAYRILAVLQATGGGDCRLVTAYPTK